MYQRAEVGLVIHYQYHFWHAYLSLKVALHQSDVSVGVAEATVGAADGMSGAVRETGTSASSPGG